jgi:hypothetical protein
MKLFPWLRSHKEDADEASLLSRYEKKFFGEDGFNKREFFEGWSSVVVASDLGENPFLVAYSRYWRNPEANFLTKILEDIVEIELQNAAYPLGVDHPDLPKAPGQSMLDAMEGFNYLLSARYPTCKMVEAPPEDIPEKNLVIFGSPSSNRLTRELFSLKKSGSRARSARHELIPAQRQRLQLPINFDLSDKSAAVIRGTRNGEVLVEPRWKLRVNDQVVVPQLQEHGPYKGYLGEDYLLLSCLPNIRDDKTNRCIKAPALQRSLIRELDNDTLSEMARQDILKMLRRAKKDASLPIRKSFVIAGLHGPGTAACRLLLQDEKVLRHLKKEVRCLGRNSHFWQALIPVTGITVEAGRDRPVGIDYKNIKVFPASANEKVYEGNT